jgi:hypothetical protein
MLYEQALSSFPELLKRLKALDQDAGVRVMGEVSGKKVFVFVTRFGPKFTMMSYAVRQGGPGRRLQTLEFDSANAAVRALKELARGRLRAWVY